MGGTVTPGAVRPDGPDPVRGALDALVAGPTPEEAAFGAGTALDKGVVVNSLVVGADGVATVDFNRKFETRDTRPQVAQVVYTLTQFPQVDQGAVPHRRPAQRGHRRAAGRPQRPPLPRLARPGDNPPGRASPIRAPPVPLLRLAAPQPH